MKIRMLTTSCGPDAEENWTENQKINVSVERARELVDAGYAVAVDPFPGVKQIAAAADAASVESDPESDPAEGSEAEVVTETAIEAPAAPAWGAAADAASAPGKKGGKK